MSDSAESEVERPSSPYREPESSPYASSPLQSSQPSSPPVADETSSSEDETARPRKKRYQYYQPEVPPCHLYGPSNQFRGGQQSFPVRGEGADPPSAEPSAENDTFNRPADSFGVDDDDGDHVDVESITACSPMLCDSVELGGDLSDMNSSASSRCDSPLSDRASPVSIADEAEQQVDSASSNDSDSSPESDEEDNLIQEVCKKVSEESDLSVDQAVVLVMELFMKHNLTKKCVGDILQVILQFLPSDNCMPRSRYFLFKYVEDLCPLTDIIHYYCKSCHTYLGETPMQCTFCGTVESNKFIQLSISEQIKNLFEIHKLYTLIDNYAAKRVNHPETQYSDLCDGEEYKRASACLSEQYDLVLLGHTDGVSLSDSSVVTFWPLEFIISNIAPNIRFKFVIFGGVWLDESKPLLNTFLKPTVNELKDCFENGVKWIHPESNVEYTSRVVVPGFCGDAPVRADLQKILHVGGRHCCNTCEQKMVRLLLPAAIEGGRDIVKRVFVLREEPSHLRTAERMRVQGEITIREKQHQAGYKPCKGVKGRSIVSKIPQCDRSTAVYPEYMHLILGLVKDFMYLWFNTRENDPWSLKPYRDEIDAFLESIQVPDYLRVSRPTKHYGKWKANECRAFLLFFSLVALSPYMRPHHLDHWLLFVCSVNLLLQETVSENDIDEANILLGLFLRDFGKLYRAQDFTYNMHSLSHLALTVKRWGPLSTNSAFFFESFNGKLTKLIHGSKNQAKELTNTLRLFQGTQALKGRVNCEDIRTVAVNIDCVELRSKILKFSLDATIKLKLSVLGVKTPMCFYRAVLRGEIYTSVGYTRQKQRNNSTVCYEWNGTKQYGDIKVFCQQLDGTLQTAVISSFDVDHLKTFCHSQTRTIVRHIIPVKPSDDTHVILVKKILFKVIRVGDYVCVRPNRLEVNL